MESILVAEERKSTRPSLLSSTFSTPQQSTFNNEINSQTVLKKPRTRQHTITVENQLSKEVDSVFNRVLSIPNIENPIEELRRQMQKLFIQKESEWAYKQNEQKQCEDDELALCKIKLKSAQSVISRMDEFVKQLSSNAPNMLRHVGSNGSLGQGAGNELANGVSTPHAHSSRTFSPDMLNDLVKERDTLREEYVQLENSYSDLFKRYEKMRENCVLLKNSEEELKNNAEEDAAKYERLLARYQELRESAAEQLNQANLELQRMAKQHEENTLGLRCRLKMNETQLQTLNLTIQGKDAQIEELNQITADLMKKNGIMDDDDAESEQNATYGF